MQEFRLKVRVDLLAQIIHVYVDDVGKGIKIYPPYVLGDERAAEHPPRLTKKKLQQRELLGRQIDTPTRASYLAGHQVEAQVRQGEHRSRHGRPAAQQGTYAREQFFKSKRLGEIIVGPTVQ